MANPALLNNDRVLVMGMGLTGYSVVRYLVKTGSRVTVADSRELPPYLGQVRNNYPDVEIIAGHVPYSRFAEFDRIIASPGVQIAQKNADSSVPLIGDIELFVQHTDAPIIAITGSNGKSTVTMLVAEMLRAAGLDVKTGGNIGTPVLDLVEQNQADFYVLELSSFQLETTCSLQACSATVLNISEDHMDRYRRLADYAGAKKRILHNAKNVVLNRDDAVTCSWSRDYANPVSFGLDAPLTPGDFGLIGSGNDRYLARGKTVLARADRVTLHGDQNLSNILAAMALVAGAGAALTPAVMNAALSYRGLPHRCEIVAQANGVTWINDSKGTNVGATVAAITGLKQNIFLIAGGQSKGADFSPLAQVIRESVDHTILIGADADMILRSLDNPAQCVRAENLEDAVKNAGKMARPGSVVLFSPACASFDMFDNYEHRGNVFRQLVRELVHSGKAQ